MKLSNFPIEIANFVCLFNAEEMLENFQRRVLPIFQNDNKIEWKKGEDRRYVLYKFGLKEIEGEVYLTGRIIRQMLLQSSQKYEEESKELKKRLKSLEDSPSSYFLLRLFDHKLILVKETVRAPDIYKVEKILQRAFDTHHDELREKELNLFKKKNKKKRLTEDLKKEFENQFRKSHPEASFRITPMANIKLIKDIFSKIDTIQMMTITLLHTNQEDSKFRTKLLKQLEESKKTIGKGNTTSIKVSITDKDSNLTKKETQAVIEDVATSAGNASFTLNALNTDGIGVKVKDHELSIKDSIPASEAISDTEKEIKACQKLSQHSKTDTEDEKLKQKKKLALALISP